MTDTRRSSEQQRSEDAHELHALGYAQELFRTMGGFSNFAISFSIISILTGAVTLYEHGLVMGGPAEMAFGWPLVTLFTLAVALSMAELASSLPTSGTMYHWASRLGGKGWGWFTAWFNIAGQLAALAGIDYGCALFVTPLLGLPMTTARVLLVYAAILLSHALINHFGIRLVALAERLQRHSARRRRHRDRRGAGCSSRRSSRSGSSSRASRSTTKAGLTGGRSCRPAAGAMDVHGLRRVRERVRRDGRSAAPRSVGHRHGGRRIEHRRLRAAAVA